MTINLVFCTKKNVKLSKIKFKICHENKNKTINMHLYMNIIYYKRKYTYKLKIVFIISQNRGKDIFLIRLFCLYKSQKKFKKCSEISLSY